MYDICCNHTPELKKRTGFEDFYYRCTVCGLKGVVAFSADKAKELWRASADRCALFNTRTMGFGRSGF